MARISADIIPNPLLEAISDNGSPYTAKGTRDFAIQLGQVRCFTLVANPKSNGLAEAFVRTFKRDYAQINLLPNAYSVLGQPGGWSDDYNDNCLHSGLDMRTPSESVHDQQPAKVSG